MTVKCPDCDEDIWLKRWGQLVLLSTKEKNPVRHGKQKKQTQDTHIVPGWSDKSQGLLAGDCVDKLRRLAETKLSKGCEL